ncbi:hypothetical protein [Pseudonocardia xinjiangensis]|uniref:Uncharacterized protein n=1 Tax=Pseudonocardia xinjiangensis TaxID=75289 RepID=A0ABX1RA63_9PSEU|nr:hypothetical protein [Pseudonocardia xinjiangensis]NMH76010.1 hypothetical protein [Pseudonocardia xinjiangensis]
MTPRITADNPTGVTCFDHASIAQLPEYVEASRALDALERAIRREDGALGQERWLDLVGAMAAALPYADACVECCGQLPTPAPHAAVVAEGRLHGDYRCPRCGSTWTRGHVLDLPGLSE